MAGSGTAHLRGEQALLSVQDLVVEYPTDSGDGAGGLEDQLRRPAG